MAGLLERRLAERRQHDLTPIRERRGGDDRRASAVTEPRWRTWTREHQAAKDLSVGRAA